MVTGHPEVDGVSVRLYKASQDAGVGGLQVSGPADRVQEDAFKDRLVQSVIKARIRVLWPLLADEQEL